MIRYDDDPGTISAGQLLGGFFEGWAVAPTPDLYLAHLQGSEVANGDPSRKDAKGTYDASYEAWVVDGDRAVAVGTSDYFSDATRKNRERRYHKHVPARVR